MSLFTRLLGFEDQPEQRAMSLDSWGNMFPLAKLAYGQEREVLGIPAALCAVRTIAEAFASLPVEIIETVGDEKRIIKDHELAYRLNVEANDELSAIDWKITAMHHLLLWGNTMSEMVFDGKGQLDSFRPLLPNYTTVLRNEHLDLVYRTTLYPSMDQVYLDSAETFHVKNLSYDGLIGLAPIQFSRTAFDLAHSQELYGNSWFANNSKPGGFYKFPNRLSQQARDNIVLSHRKEFAGATNANKVGILDDGGSFELTTIPSDDGQFLASRTFQLSEIARIFNINPVFLHDLNASWANLETLSTMFCKQTLLPWVHRWEAELKRKVLGRHTNLSAHFNVSGLLRGDIATRFTVYSGALQNGIYSINECRRFEGLPSIGPEGDVHRVQLNMGTGEAGEQQPSSPEPDIANDEGEVQGD